MPSNKIRLLDLFRYYKGLPHQAASISLLEEDLAANGYNAECAATGNGLRLGASQVSNLITSKH